MEERDFFDERSEKKNATLTCPHCQQAAEYEINWLVRSKKKQIPGRADERDRARFAKARSYMLRRDDMMACKNMRCRKRFEISGVQSVVFTE
jgi:HEPN domain-containing protein